MRSRKETEKMHEHSLHFFSQEVSILPAKCQVVFSVRDCRMKNGDWATDQRLESRKIVAEREREEDYQPE